MITETKYWQVLTLTAEPHLLDIIGSMLITDSLGSAQNNGDVLYYFEPELKDNIEARLQGLSLSYVFTREWSTQEQEPWHLAWKDNFTPVDVNGRILVVPDWDTDSTAEILVRIRPGMAFGTGHHETTWLMLDALQSRLIPGMRVLDVGSGSGILAIAARKMGAASIDCVEYDPVCSENFHENLELNALQDGIHLEISDILEYDDFSQDLILANVNSQVIRPLIPRMTSARAVIVLSGLLKTDEPEIRRICEEHQFNILDVVQKGEWIRMEIQRIRP